MSSESKKLNFVTNIGNVCEKLVGSDGLYWEILKLLAEFNGLYKSGKVYDISDTDFKGTVAHLRKSDLVAAMQVFNQIKSVIENDAEQTNLVNLQKFLV